MKLEVTVTGGEAAAAALAAVRSVTADELAATMVEGTTEALRAHFRTRNQIPNALGGARTNYWLQAADATTGSASGAVVTVEVAHRGVRLHYLGGEVRASGRTSEITGKPIRFLTIPVHPLGHGNDVAKLRQMGVELYRAGDTLRRQEGPERRPGDEIIFVLRRRVKRQADATVLPADDVLTQGAADGLDELWDGLGLERV